MTRRPAASIVGRSIRTFTASPSPPVMPPPASPTHELYAEPEAERTPSPSPPAASNNSSPFQPRMPANTSTHSAALAATRSPATPDPGYDADVSNTSAETALSGFTEPDHGPAGSGRSPQTSGYDADAEGRSRAPVAPASVPLPVPATLDALNSASVQKDDTSDADSSDADADDEDSDSGIDGDKSDESYTSEDDHHDTDTSDSSPPENDDNKHASDDRRKDLDDASSENGDSDASSVSSATRTEVARLYAARRPLVRPASPPEVWAARQRIPPAPSLAPLVPLRINADGRATPGRVLDLFSPLTPPPPPSPPFGSPAALANGLEEQNELALVMYVLEGSRLTVRLAERGAAHATWTGYLLRTYRVSWANHDLQLAVIRSIMRRVAAALIGQGRLVLGRRHPTAEAWAIAIAAELHEFALEDEDEDSHNALSRGRCRPPTPPPPPPPPPGRDVSDLVRAIGYTASRVIYNDGAITSDDEPNPEISWSAQGVALRDAARRASPVPSDNPWRKAKDEAFAYCTINGRRVERADSAPLPDTPARSKRPRDDVDEDYDTPVSRFHPAARLPAHLRKRARSTRVLAGRRVVSETMYELAPESVGTQVRAALDELRTERDVAKVLDWAPGALAAIDAENASLRHYLGATISVALETSHMQHLVVQTLDGEYRVWADNLLENLRIRARVVQAHTVAEERYSALDEPAAYVNVEIPPHQRLGG